VEAEKENLQLSPIREKSWNAEVIQALVEPDIALRPNPKI